MRSMTTTLTNHARTLGLSLLAAAVLFTALAALPSSSSDTGISSVAPQSAQAFEGGIDGDHAWVKVTAGEIAGGAVDGLCRSVAPGPVKVFCPRVAQIARDMIGGRSGVWAEVYPNGHVNAGTW